MPVRHLVALVQIALVVCVAAACAIGFTQARAAAARVDALRSRAVVPLVELKALSDAYAVSVVDMAHKVRNGGMQVPEARAAFVAAQAQIRSSFAALDAAPPEAGAWAEVRRRSAAADATVARIGAALERADVAALEAVVLQALYRDIDPLTEAIGGLTDSVIARADASLAEANASAERDVLLFAVLSGLALLVGLAGMLVLRQRVALPLQAMTSAMTAVADGHLDTAVPAAGRRDEIGAMAGALEVLRRRSMEARELRAAQEVERAEAEEARVAALRDMAARLERETRNSVADIGDQASRMDGAAREMNELAGRVSAASTEVSAAARLAMSHAEGGAAAAEEMTASIRSIATQVESAAAATHRAVRDTEAGSRAILGLQEAVGRIGQVARLIGDIAAQTNLLALNATIEAARAGEAGKGFAVVAQEVKTLASQTGRSTEEIARHIQEIGTATEAAVAAVRATGATINELDGIAATIAEAMAQQDAATAEIARTVAGTAEAARGVAERIGGVAGVAEEVHHRADMMRDAVTETSAAMEALRVVLLDAVRGSTPEVNRRAATRHALWHAATIRHGSGAEAVHLSDLSRGGASVHGLRPLRPGTRVSLEAPGLAGSYEAELHAIEDGRSRLRFLGAGPDDSAIEALAMRSSVPRAA